MDTYTVEKSGKIAFWTYYSMRIVVMLSIVAFIIDGNFESAVSALFILGLMVLPSLLKEQYRLHLPFEIDLAIVAFIFLSLFLGSLQDYYERFPLWDGILHFQSGILLGAVGFLVVYLLNERKQGTVVMSPGFISLFSVCFSMALSVVWEIYEYTVDNVFGYTMQESGLPDTMGDLIVNAIASIAVATVAYVWMKRRRRLPFAPRFLKKFVFYVK